MLLEFILKGIIGVLLCRVIPRTQYTPYVIALSISNTITAHLIDH